MVRGCMRHTRFQRAVHKQLQTVGSLYSPPIEGRGRLSIVFTKKLKEILINVSHETPIYTFIEVKVDRSISNSRRADIVLYIPKSCVICIEFKTIEQKGVLGNNLRIHYKQLKETYDNLVAQLSCHLSQKNYGLVNTPLTAPKLIPAYMLLVSRRFWTGKFLDDYVLQYEDNIRSIQEPSDPQYLITLLKSLSAKTIYNGKRCSK